MKPAIPIVRFRSFRRETRNDGSDSWVVVSAFGNDGGMEFPLLIEGMIFVEWMAVNHDVHDRVESRTTRGIGEAA